MRAWSFWIFAIAIGLGGAARAEERDDERPPLHPAFDYRQSDELARRARRKKISGGILIGVGTALSVAGQILLFDNLIRNSIGGDRGLGTLALTCAGGFCAGTGEGIAGLVSLVVGTALVYSGIPIYAIGGAERARARKLGGLALHGRGARLTIRF